ncbi:putative ribonuclease H-like domain-containing protein [Tanacetum coccineum]|uniref:Ribonuclease H-like domain-containing protein n=1 Tax=Tanacetum coccineum TaxID=301880 RepID=A0ABQ5G2E8_9ASTR
MDVKSVFLYGKIEEEVYVCQPPGFEDPNFSLIEYTRKVEKALYGLHQAPRAWYETLSTYLLDNGFQRGKIDKTLFIRRDKGDILLVQVYVDDIIFGSTKKSLCTEFEKMMHKKFQMSSMGELTFFLGLQVKQKEDGIFISQDKYVTKILKKFGFTDVKTASTPMETQKPLLKDEDGEEVDVHMYRSMIGSLMYLTSSRPDIMFAVCACARYQVNPKVSHLYTVKRIFRYLKGQPKLGLWYPKDSPFNLVAYTDSDYAGASLDRKSTIGGKAKKSVRLMMEKLFGMELELILVPQPSDPSENVTDEAVHKELGDRLVRAATTASSLEVEHDSGNITKTQSKATPNESSSLGTTLSGGPRCQETIGDTIAQTRVLDLEKTKTSQANEIASLKRRVKKLKKKDRSRTHKLKRLYKVGLTAMVESSSDEEDLDDADNEMFDVNALNGEEVLVAGQNENVVEEVVDAAQVNTAATTVTIITKEITLAQALEALKTSKPKLQAEFDEEERLAREKAKKEKEANIALIETWDDIQAKIDADHQLAERLQAQEQEELSVEEKATLFQQLLEKRRKHFAAKRAEEKRNKPLTKAQ